MKERLAISMILALAVGVLAPTAHADFYLSLNDGVAPGLTIHDGDALDGNTTAGVITYIGAVGTRWTINVTTGQSDAVLGGPWMKELDLNSVDTSTSGGTPPALTIVLYESGLSLPLEVGEAGMLTSSIGGTAGGTIELIQTLAWRSGSVALDTGLLGPGAFASTQTAAVLGLGPNEFSLTEQVVITHPSSARGITTSYDAQSTVVPVPGAILLGFLGLGAAGVKLRRFA